MKSKILYITQNSYYFVHRFFIKFFERSDTKVIFVKEKKRGRIKKYREIINIFGLLNSLNIIIAEIFYLLKFYKRKSKLDCITLNDDNLNKFLETKVDLDNYDFIISLGCPCKINNLIQKKFSDKLLNIHGGIVPFQRGRFSPAKALLNKDKFIGATIHKISTNFDDGEILSQGIIKLDFSKSKLFIYDRVLFISSEILDNFLLGKYLKIPNKIKNYFEKKY